MQIPHVEPKQNGKQNYTQTKPNATNTNNTKQSQQDQELQSYLKQTRTMWKYQNYMQKYGIQTHFKGASTLQNILVISKGIGNIKQKSKVQ